MVDDADRLATKGGSAQRAKAQRLARQQVQPAACRGDTWFRGCTCCRCAARCEQRASRPPALESRISGLFSSPSRRGAHQHHAGRASLKPADARYLRPYPNSSETDSPLSRAAVRPGGSVLGNRATPDSGGIADQRDLVAWWDKHVRGAGRPPLIPADRQEFSMEDAERLTGVKNWQVSRWPRPLRAGNLPRHAAGA
jgi:hypothetical protein